MLGFIKKEPVLFAAVVLALISMIFVPPSFSYAEHIDFKTLVCLLCLMISLKGLERGGLLNRIAGGLAVKIANARAMAFFLVYCCFFAAMLMTNDVALIALVPVTLVILSLCKLEEWSAFIIVLQTIAANVGSSLTPIGNPQNLYLFTHYKMHLGSFVFTMLPFALIGGALLGASCFLIPRRRLVFSLDAWNASLRPVYIISFLLMFIISVSAVLGFVSYWIALACIVIFTIVIDRKSLKEVDYSLLLTFTAIFIFVGNISSISVINEFLSVVIHANPALAAIIASQFISNVPAAILLSGFTNRSAELLVGVNVGGLGTLIASMASVISYRIFTNVNKGQFIRFIKIFTLWNVIFLAALSAAAIFIL